MEDKDMYEKMKKELLEALKDTLADSFKVKTYTVFKNGKEVEAFLITEEDSAVSPTFLILRTIWMIIGMELPQKVWQ